MFIALLCSFLSDRRGNFTTTFGLTIFPILLMAGIAVDYSLISQEESKLQETADSAAFFAVKELEKAGKSENDLKEEAHDAVDSNFTIEGDVTVHLDSQANLLTVQLSKQYQPAFLKLVHPDPMQINVTATVAYTQVYEGAKCFMSLSETGKGVLNLNGNAVIDAPTCGVHVNSSSSDAVDLNGSGTSITAQSNCFVGGVQSGYSRIQPPLEDECHVLPDPFDEYPLPSFGNCDHYSYKVNANKSVTLEPGVYCDNLSIGSGADVTFAPGLYVIKDGRFKTTGGATLSGDGVSFLFTGDDVAVDFSGGTTFHLVAMDSGELAGFLFFFDPDADLTQTSSFSGNSSTYFEGILHFGRRDVSVSGGGVVNTGSPLSVLIANTITLNGNAQINFAVDEDATDLPIPDEIYNKSISPYLVQ